MTSGNEPETFESIYARATDDLSLLPWADLAPSPDLAKWLDGESIVGSQALVIGCGVGDDAEELARRGAYVVAFDFSPTAIALCRRRFPTSAVRYVVADVFDLPSSWRHGFDVVVEIHTVQSIPLRHQAAAMQAIADTVAARGQLFVRCNVRNDDAPLGDRPWFLRLGELDAYVDAGLSRETFDDVPTGPAHPRYVRAVYARR